MQTQRALVAGSLLVGFAAGCGGDEQLATPDACPAGSCEPPVDATPADAAPPDAVPPEFPLTIDQTGLCDDPACATISADVRAYTPQFALWSDGATKRRWIYLPPGTQIDTSNMDYWQFPVGTKLWKEFTRDGVRVETRYMTRYGAGPGDWKMVSYVWNAAQDRAEPTLLHLDDVLGTTHDVPSRNECRQCHENIDGRVLGFGAIQLDRDGAVGEVDLTDLVADDLLTDPPAGATPRFPLPGTAGEQAALGYLHVNCGTCHNPTTGVVTPDPQMALRLEVGALADAASTPTYLTTMGVPVADPRITPGNVDASKLYQKFNLTGGGRMPPLGTEITDVDGATTLKAWILGL